MLSPKDNPIINLEDYLTSKSDEQELIKRDFEQYHSVSRELDRLRRHFLEVKDQLEEKRKVFTNKKVDFKKQWVELEEKELNFKENFVRFSTFVKENWDKKIRAQEKLKDDMKFRKEKERQIEYLNGELSRMKLSKTDMEKKVKEYKIYENYLYSVIALGGSGFKSIDDILNRYECFMEAKAKLSETQENSMAALENAKSDMVKLVESCSLILMGLHTQLSQLNGRYEEALTNSHKWEDIVGSVKDTSLQKRNEIDMVKCSIWNNYVLMCKRKKMPVRLPPGDIEEQVIFIKNALKELRSIRKIIARSMKKKLSKSHKK